MASATCSNHGKFQSPQWRQNGDGLAPASVEGQLDSSSIYCPRDSLLSLLRDPIAAPSSVGTTLGVVSQEELQIAPQADPERQAEVPRSPGETGKNICSQYKVRPPPYRQSTQPESCPHAKHQHYPHWDLSGVTLAGGSFRIGSGIELYALGVVSPAALPSPPSKDG